VERAISPRTRAILAVHTFGIPAQMDTLKDFANRRQLALIEDASEAIGARFDGRIAGSFGDLAVLGFYPNKQITTGEGGAVLAGNPAHAARLRRLRNQGRDSSPDASADASPGARPDANVDWLDHAEPGYNYRLSELACALGRVQLQRIDEILALRSQAAEHYAALLADVPGLERPPISLPRRELSWFVYVVRLPEGADRERVQAALLRQGIATGRYFAPIHLQPAWRVCCRSVECNFSLTESIARRTLALPFFNRITEGQQREVADALREAISCAA
jgi:perosamine synthetase